MFVCRTVALLCLLPLIAHAVVVPETEDDLAPKRLCPSCAVKCSATGGTTAWGIADGVCRVFVNDCAFLSENCRRQGKCLKAMVKSTQRVCQRSCPRFCKSKKREVPVCASYLNATGEIAKSVTFRSQCKLDILACSRAKPYSFVTKGACV